MIKFINETVDKTIRFLQENYPMKEDVFIHVMEGYDCVEGPDGNKGFGVYVPETKTIFVAGDVPEPERTLVETIAHEYRHFMQHCEGKPFIEEQAESFALYVVWSLSGE